MGRQGGQGKGKPKLKDKNFGKALIRQQTSGTQGIYGTRLKFQPKMNSLLETNPLDDFIAMAEMDENTFEVDKVINENAYLLESLASTKVISEQFSSIQDPNELKKQRTQEMTIENFQQLQLVIPRKPKWYYSMTSEQIQRNEMNAFLAWRRNIAKLEQTYSYLLKLTPYEKNLEIWRQLWRVCERSNLLIQVIDARNPLLYYTKDLFHYLQNEFPPTGKAMILLINKADLLTEYQRFTWFHYFQKRKMKVLFYSAYQSQEWLDSLNELELQQENSFQFDLQGIYDSFQDFLQSFDLKILNQQYLDQGNKKMNHLDGEEEVDEEEIVWGDGEEFVTKVNKVENTVTHLTKEAVPKQKSDTAARVLKSSPSTQKQTKPIEVEEDDEDENEEDEVEDNEGEEEDDDAYDDGELEEVGSDEYRNENHEGDEEDDDYEEEEEDGESDEEEGDNKINNKPKKFINFTDPSLPVNPSSKILTRRELLGILTFLAKAMKDELEITDEGKTVRLKEPSNTLPVHQTILSQATKNNKSRSASIVPPAQPIRPSFGLVGYPNVGKSSVINTLLGVSRANHGKARVGVSSTPGKTKHFQTLILSPEILLCDCPGLVFPSIMSSAGEMLCSGILPVNHMKDHLQPANLIAARVPSHILEAAYGMSIVRNLDVLDHPDRPPTGEEMMYAYCKVKGYITGHTGRWDEFRACKEILRDFNDGKIIYVALPPKLQEEEDGTLKELNNPDSYTKEEKEQWMKETEQTIIRNHKIAERISSKRVNRLPVNDPTTTSMTDTGFVNAEGEVIYEYVAEEEKHEDVTEELNSLSLDDQSEFLSQGTGPTTMIHPNRLKREHKRIKTWGKKGKKLREKTPYGETDDLKNYTIHITNRHRVGVDLVK